MKAGYGWVPIQTWTSHRHREDNYTDLEVRIAEAKQFVKQVSKIILREFVYNNSIRRGGFQKITYTQIKEFEYS